MKKNRSTKIIIAISLILILSTTSVLAAPFDLIHINNQDKNHKFTEFVDSPTVFDEVVEDVDYYLIESGEGSLYYVSEVNDATSDGISFNDAIADLDPYEGELNKDITAEAELYGSLLGVDSYSIYIKGASNEDVERVRINDKEVTFEIIEGVLMVNTAEDVNSMDILVNGITVEVSLGEQELFTEKDLKSIKEEAENLNEDDYTSNSWSDLQEALILPESTEREIDEKVKDINLAIENLLERIQFLGTFNDFFKEDKLIKIGNTEYKGIEALPIPGIYNIYLDTKKLKNSKFISAEKDNNLKMKIDNDWLMDGNYDESFTFLTTNTKSFYILPAIQDGINYWTEISPEKIGVIDSSIIHKSEIYLINQ